MLIHHRHKTKTNKTYVIALERNKNAPVTLYTFFTKKSETVDVIPASFVGEILTWLEHDCVCITWT